MEIPMPCKFGEMEDCKGVSLPFVGVSWFRWSQSWEFTYFFRRSKEWSQYSFYTTDGKEMPCSFSILDSLLADGSLLEKGFPFKARGYVTGLCKENGKLYLDFLLTSHYFAHIKVECDEQARYVPFGDIVFPPSWDTEEKKSSIFSKRFLQKIAEK